MEEVTALTGMTGHSSLPIRVGSTAMDASRTGPISTRTRGRLVGLLLGVTAALSISLTNVFSRLHFEAGSNPVTFLLGRYILFVAIVAAGLAIAGRLPRIERRYWPDLAIAGLLNVSGAASLAFAIERLQVSLAIAVLYLFPIFTLLMDSALRRRAPAPWAVAALALAFAGLLLALGVVGGDAGAGRAPPDPVGLAFALGAAVGIAASFVWMEHRLAALGDSARVLGLAGVGLGFAVGLSLIGGGVIWPLPSAEAWITLVVATATFGAACAAMFTAISRIGATSTSTLMNLEPPATALFAMLLLGDRSSPGQMLGIGVVVAAVLLAQVTGGQPGSSPTRRQ